MDTIAINAGVRKLGWPGGYHFQSGLPSVATVERHDESKTPFQKQLGWHPAPDDDSLILADRIFIKHGYAPSPETIEYLKSLKVDRVLVCDLQTETCCLAAGFALFDTGLQPTLITDLTEGSSLDRTGALGIRLWEHHFKHTVKSTELLPHHRWTVQRYRIYAAPPPARMPL